MNCFTILAQAAFAGDVYFLCLALFSWEVIAKSAGFLKGYNYCYRPGRDPRGGQREGRVGKLSLFMLGLLWAAMWDFLELSATGAALRGSGPDPRPGSPPSALVSD